MTAMTKDAAKEAAHHYFPSFLRSREQARLIDKWVKGRQYDIDDQDVSSPFNGQVFRPNTNDSGGVTDEYTQLESISPSNWAGLITRSLSQTAYVEGIRLPKANDNISSWATWQANRWDAKQGPLHNCAIAQGAAYGVVLPGTNPLTGDKMSRYLAKSPVRMAAFYDNDDDEWPVLAIEGDRFRDEHGMQGWTVQIYDERVVHYLSCEGDGTELAQWTWIEDREHGLPVPPVARLANRLDLDGVATGEIEPVLPLLRRLDQDTFDRLIVQRFGAWKVRYIAGMAKPKTPQEERVQAIKLRIQDLLVSDKPETKFGTLDSTDPNGFIAVNDHDLRMLSAITQTPPHHLLGLSSNLQAEALAAAEAGLQRKSIDFRMNAGEFHEQMARMDAMYRGDRAIATAVDLQVRWKDTESRSFNQTAQALGYLATQLKVPVEMLWERIPNWTDSDTERAKQLVQDGSIETLLAELANSATPDQTQAQTQAQPGQQTGGTGAPPANGQ